MDLEHRICSECRFSGPSKYLLNQPVEDGGPKINALVSSSDDFFFIMLTFEKNCSNVFPCPVAG